MDVIASAQRVRVYKGGKVEERRPGGSDLAKAIDRAGAGGTVSLLADGIDAVELEDGDLTVRVARDAGGARVRSVWRSGEVVEQLLPLTRASRPVADVVEALHDPSRPLRWHDGRWWEGEGPADGMVPALSPDRLGAPSFREAHGVRRNYVAGAMAGGIASPALVVAMGRAGYLGYFGAGGLPVDAVRDGVRAIRAAGAFPSGFNLLHNPAEPAVEEATVDLFLEHGCTEVDASAFMGLTPSVVRFRLHGIHEAEGRIVTPNRVAAKVSRPEVAEPFLRPAPARLLDELVAAGKLTRRQAELGARVPVAEDITAEADSGGHTDRRPLPVLIPIFRRLADRIAAECGYAVRPRVGAAGGVGDPWSLAAALALGADYVMTGSVNQATREAGTSDAVRELLAQAGYADVTMGPAPDMFEIGANVQVLGRGTMYAQRASRLYELYKGYASIEEIPKADLDKIEKQIFQRPLAEVWKETEAFWRSRDPRELDRAAKDGRHKMALCFRWYLGLSSRWARVGDAQRKRDFQIWCGPAMGLFNDWVRGTWLEPLPARSVVAVADALMHGACVAMRVNAARVMDPGIPAAAGDIRPWRAPVDG
jgi:PfaD family protein